MKPRFVHILWIAPVVVITGCASGLRQSTASPTPHLDDAIAFADSAIQASIGKLMPGAVLVVTKNGEIIHNRAFGVAVPGGGTVTSMPDGSKPAYEITVKPIPMRVSTVFDLASVTKVMATTFAMMILVDQGKVDLDAPVYTYLRDFRGPHLDSITVRHLLQHSAGLVQWQPLYYQASNTQQTYDAIRNMPLQWGVGEGRHYSDFSFMLLGDIVERVSGKRLDVFINNVLYEPLGLSKTTFNPKKKGLKEFAATEVGNGYEKHMVYDSTFGYRYRGDPTAWNGWRTYQTVGEVNDGNSFYANGGVAGHAGLFSTGSELSVLLQVLLNGGTYEGHRYVSQNVIDRFFVYDKYNNYLGWQYPAQLHADAFSHTGFTGTYVLGDRLDNLSIVLLTNRQAMGTNEKGFFPDLAPLQTAIAGALISGAQLDTRQQ